MQSSSPLPPLRKIGLLGSLYLSQGLPYGFFTQAVPVLLRKGGSSLEAVSLSSLLLIPWALKFVWAPLVDRHGWASFGRRRSWIVPMQAATALVLAAISVRDAGKSTAPLLFAMFLVSLLSATQDIATDGLAVDMLEEHERGLGNAVQVGGYRVGMILGGGALLVVFERAGWTLTFLSMAALIAVATIPILATREPEAWPHAAPRRDPAETANVRASVIAFLRRPNGARIIGLLVIYKLGEAFATGMLRPFLSDAGLSIGQIGELVGTVGFVAGLVGAVVGGGLVNRLGRRRALVSFAVIQMITVAGYACVAHGKPSTGALYAICAAEHLGSGMATAALFTCMMDWCAPETNATDYTVQACAVVIASGSAAALSGFSAGRLGYFGHFALATVVALGAVIAAHRLFPPTQASAAPRGKTAPAEAS